MSYPSSTTGPADFEYDTDAIRSIDSEDLYEARPNRWQGPRSTWRTLVEDDTLTHALLVQSRNRDLAVHLYNAFALKHGRRAPPEAADDVQDVDRVTGQVINWDHGWKPPKSWTAWPMREHLVPRGDAFGNASDDARETYRHPLPPAHPSAALEELISATMLKLAKEKFLKRKLAQPSKPQEAEGSDPEAATITTTTPRPPHQPVFLSSSPAPKPEPDTKPAAAALPPPADYPPVVSADDHLSYELLRPSARHILSALDRTLMVLHNARVAGINYLSESSATNTSESEGASPARRGRGRPRSTRSTPGGSRQASAPPVPMFSPERAGGDAPDARRASRPQGRPRSRYRSVEGETELEARERIARQRHERLPFYDEDVKTGDDEEHETFETAAEEDEEGDDARPKAQQQQRRKRNRGKPRKEYAREPGESERAYLVRIARLQHKKIPSFSDDEDDDAKRLHTEGHTTAGEDEENNDNDKPPTRRHSHLNHPNQDYHRPASPPLAITPEQNALHRRRLLDAWSPRDWSDVLGAASLSGLFPPAALSRAAQRCADLFGQCVDLRTLPEQRGGGGGAGRLTRYAPRPRLRPSIEHDDDDDDDDDDADDGDEHRAAVRHLRALSSRSRQSSAAAAYASDSSPGAHTTASRKRSSSSRRRHRSSSAAAAALVYCPHATCPRAIQGFSRRANLARHMRLVHGGGGGGGVGSASPAAATESGGDRDEDEDEDDDEDEGEMMSGAVHVDGFLQVIKTQKGWRGEQVQGRRKGKEKGKGRGKKGGRAWGVESDEEDDGVGDVNMHGEEYGDESDS